MTRRRIGVLASGILGLLLAAGPARGDHVRGIRITVTSTVGTTVNFNITLYTDGGPRFLGVGATTPLGTPAFGVNGINYGDGVIRAGGPGCAVPCATAVSGVARGPLGLYRRSFSHTYPDTTRRTLRVGSPFGVGAAGAPNNTIIVGNPIFGPNPTYAPTYRIAVTNTVTVFAFPVPTLPSPALWLLALVLIIAGTRLLGGRSWGARGR